MDAADSVKSLKFKQGENDEGQSSVSALVCFRPASGTAHSIFHAPESLGTL